MKLAIAITVAITFTGCTKILDLSPQNNLSEDMIWEDIDLVEGYVYDNYNALGGWPISLSASQLSLPGSLTDDIFDTHGAGVVYNYNIGNFAPDNMGVWQHEWKTDYKYIRNVNIFLSHIDQVDADDVTKERLSGEMRFLRAWCYARLADFFGGVPIITDAFELNDDVSGISRNSYEETISWIVDELDKIKDLVPITVSGKEFGRITKGAVLALKSRVLLYAASKLHDPGEYPSGPLYDYDKPEKWKDAATAAEDVMSLGIYSLVQVNNWKDYHDIFMHNNGEIILAQQYAKQYKNTSYGSSYQRYNGLPSEGGYGSNNPTQDLINDFQMKDGKSIDNSPLYDHSPSTIYENRELRFYADVIYQGTGYRNYTVDFSLPGGNNSTDADAQNYPKAGYLIRKSMDENQNIRDDQNPIVPKVFFRMAEIYLNYAEAEFHLGHEDIAREYINKIRRRVNLPDIHSSGIDLLKDIQHERRIELVFEGYHRFDDLRRWKLAEEELNKDAEGIKWKRVDANGNLSANGILNYEFIHVQDRDFNKRQYYLPIPQSEIERSNLDQNQDYVH